MSEGPPIHLPEVDPAKLRGEIGVLSGRIFDETITNINEIVITPSTPDEWRLHMPTLALITSKHDKKLHSISIHPHKTLASGETVYYLYIRFKQFDVVSFGIEDKEITFSGPVSTGNMYKVREIKKLDITADAQRLQALKEALEYCLLIRQMDQLE